MGSMLLQRIITVRWVVMPHKASPRKNTTQQCLTTPTMCEEKLDRVALVFLLGMVLYNWYFANGTDPFRWWWTFSYHHVYGLIFWCPHIGFTFSRRSHTQSLGLVHLHIYLKIIFSDVATSISSLPHKSFGFISSLRTWPPAWMGRKVHVPSLLQHCRHKTYSPIALQRNPDVIWVKKHFFQSHHSNCSKFSYKYIDIV